MKKTAAILLSGILLFNWFGYRMLNAYLQDQATASMEMALNQNDYDETALVSFKIPAALPYYTNSPDFERVDGVIVIAGIHYNYVKRRVFNDSLEYLCIPNHEKTKLSDAKDAFFKLVNDLQQPQKKGGGNNLIVKKLLSEFWQDDNSWSLPLFRAENQVPVSLYRGALLTRDISSLEQPPDAC